MKRSESFPLCAIARDLSRCPGPRGSCATPRSRTASERSFALPAAAESGAEACRLVSLPWSGQAPPQDLVGRFRVERKGGARFSLPDGSPHQAGRLSGVQGKNDCNRRKITGMSLLNVQSVGP
ncbi:hypothetical protein AOLI_G00066330 [Acnodon oligacanthus]